MAGLPAGLDRPCAASVQRSTEDHVYPVHLQDYNFRKLIMVCTLRYDHVLDANKMCHGLTRLLEKGDWRKLGGRLRYSADGNLEIHVPQQYSSERPAFTFSHNNLSNMPIREHDLARKLPVPTDNTSIQPNQYNLIELGVRPGIPETIDDMIDRDLPQLSLHITSFQDATLVGISWPHSVMDSLGFKAFLQSWSLVVQGREIDVPPLLGAREDVMLHMENQEPASSREALIIQKYRLIGAKLLLFVLRYIWAMLWNPAPEVRSVFLPKAALERLHSACQYEVSDQDTMVDEATKPASVDQERTLLAWFIRTAVSATARSKPVTILNFLNVRHCLSSFLDQRGAYVQNMVCYSFSFLSGQVAGGPLQPLVREHNRHIQDQATEQQCLSFLRAYRRETEGGKAFKLFFGPSDAHVIGCNSFVNADLVHTANFSAAAVLPAGLEKDHSAPPGTMTCFYYHIMNNRLGCGPQCIYLLGKDHGENMWVVAALPPNVWKRIETALKDYD